MIDIATIAASDLLDEEAVVTTSAVAGRIVVGVDGSEGSRPALDWTVQEAELRHVPVHAVMAWQLPLSFGGPTPWSVGHDPSVDAGELATAAAAGAAVEVARIRASAPPPPNVEVTDEVVEGHPAELLLRAAEDADLLVVGSRGHGGLAGALLRSVSQHLVQHAHCPIVVIPNRIGASS